MATSLRGQPQRTSSDAAVLLGVMPQFYCNDFGSDRFLGEYLVNSASISCAVAGAATLPCRRISFTETSRPYNFRFARLSGRKVEPSRETPANSPREREYDSISARMTTSVDPSALRPFGPAAAEASAPSFTLLPISDSAPRGFITRIMKSVACPPSWNPKFTPSSAYMAGAVHAPV